MPSVKRTKESVIERALVDYAKARGGVCWKVRVIGQRGFVDRLIVLPYGRVIFVELKRPRGGRLSPHQKQWHAEMRALDVEVAVVRNLADIAMLL